MKSLIVRGPIFLFLGAVLIMVPTQTFANFFERSILPPQGMPEQLGLLIFGAGLLGFANFIKRNVL